MIKSRANTTATLKVKITRLFETPSNRWFYGSLIAILVLATLLRTWQLSTKAIFFGDAAHDVLAAHQAIENRHIPLLGISSSVPRFKQGPLAVWINAFSQILFGPHLLFTSLLYALISVASVIALYELLSVYETKQAGWWAAALLAVSPLAVAHGRMPYHITPIPLMMVLFLWALMRIWQKKPRAVFWATLAWCGVFQFELAVFPLILLIPYIVWRVHKKWKVLDIKSGLIALLIGLSPQIIYDLTHRFQQLGGFLIWVGYRIVSLTGAVGTKAFTPDHFKTALSAFNLFGTRIFSYDQPIIALLGLIGLIICWWTWGKLLKNNQLSHLKEIVLVSSGILMAAYLMHGNPSEAYFPPLIILWLTTLGIGVSELKLPKHFLPQKSLVYVVLGMWISLQTYSIVSNNFFVSNSARFSYGLSTGDQRQVAEFIRTDSQGDFKLRTTNEGGIYPAYFDNLRWWLQQANAAESPTSYNLYFVEAAGSVLNDYPTMKLTTIGPAYVYRIQ
jgi:hypothetical protein